MKVKVTLLTILFTLCLDLNCLATSSQDLTVSPRGVSLSNGTVGRDQNRDQARVPNFSYVEPPGERGWWWYKDEKKEKEPPEQVQRPEQKVEIPEKVAKEEDKKEEILPLEKYTYEELLYMDPEKFNKIFTHYLHQAIKEPNEQNMFYFFNILDVARKKAALFSNMYAYTMQKYSQYLPTTAYPLAYPGIAKRAEQIDTEVKEYVFGKKDMYGLIVFLKSGCPYCQVQLNILKRAEQQGLRVKKVYYESNPDIVTKFGIEMFPTIIMVHKDGRYIPIGSGVVSLDDIYKAIARGLRIFEGDKTGRFGLYEFQQGTPLDPYEPPPLWRKNK